MKQNSKLIFLAFYALILMSCSKGVREVGFCSHGCVKISTIRKNKANYLGRVVKMSVIYKTDNLHFTTLSDAHVGAGEDKYDGMILAGSETSGGDPSIFNFFKNRKKACKEQEKLGHSLCLQSIHVNGYFKILNGDDGLVADFVKITSYDFIKGRNKD